MNRVQYKKYEAAVKPLIGKVYSSPYENWTYDVRMAPEHFIEGGPLRVESIVGKYSQLLRGREWGVGGDRTYAYRKKILLQGNTHMLGVFLGLGILTGWGVNIVESASPLWLLFLNGETVKALWVPHSALNSVKVTECLYTGRSHANTITLQAFDLSVWDEYFKLES